MTEKQIKRCVIYTRKSHEEGLDQEFNSLDAQRESAENYIKSQKDNGWRLLPERYDDGGFSGGTTERPALKRLMNDVEAGKIDIIVVYKLDRLSRSLLDFMNMADFFERHNVSFVSVTQEINTSTSAGRMMLNILMTFAQYEREVIAERIRDKIAGAKRRGKHCGGPPVLGYDANIDTKKLEINKEEAKIVREAFELYVKFGSAKDVARILNEKGYRTKAWITRKGGQHTGDEFCPKTIYRMVANVIYLGQVHHKDKIYDGEHEAIIDQALWEKARQIMDCNTRAVGFRKNTINSPFKGLLKCGYCDDSLGITYTGSSGRRYLYYVCAKDEKRAVRECQLSRAPAGDVDRVILAQLGKIFRTPALLFQAYQETLKVDGELKKLLQTKQEKLKRELEKLREKIEQHPEDHALRNNFMESNRERTEVEEQLKMFDQEISCLDIVNAFSSIDVLWDELFPAERYRLVHLLIDRITLFEDKMIIDIKTAGMKSLVKELKVGEDVMVAVPADHEREIISLTVPLLIRRRHGRKVVLIPGTDEYAAANGNIEEPSKLAKHLAKAHVWMEMIEKGEVANISQLAKRLGEDQSYIGKILKLVNLSPELQQAIIEGREPESLTMARLRKPFPEDWEEQKKVFAS